MSVRRFPASYQNTPVRDALAALAAQPSLAGLEALMAASVRGGLAVDLTGSTRESGALVRTIVSTDGRPILPLFTSIAEVKLAIAMSQRPASDTTVSDVSGSDATEARSAAKAAPDTTASDTAAPATAAPDKAASDTAADVGPGSVGTRSRAAGIAAQAAILPAVEALALIRSNEFVAVQFDPGSTAQVVVRAHIETALERAGK